MCRALAKSGADDSGELRATGAAARSHVFLQSYGITPSLAVKIFKQYGENVKQIIRSNPYRLVEDVEGIGFKTADKIAAAPGR